MISFAGFVLCTIVILFAGKKLSFYGDMIGSLTGWGNVWVGLILMASVTSLPELMVGLSSSAIVQSADLAVGNILGSSAFNLGILALMDVFVPQRKTIFGSASQNHVMAAAMGIILISLAGAGLFLPGDIVFTPWIGLSSVLFIVVYFFFIRLIYGLEKRTALAMVAHEDKAEQLLPLKKAVLRFSAFALVTVAAALLLPHFAEQIADRTGLDRTFIGTLFLAAATSLPEIAVSFAAVRMGSLDLAVGNLLGSNIFNIFILALNDLFYTKGHLLKDASDLNMVSVLATVIMAAIAIIGLTYRSEAKRFLMAWDAVLIFLIYILNMFLLYNLTF